MSDEGPGQARRRDQILVLNAGSSSLKMGLFADDGRTPLADSTLDWTPDAPGAVVQGLDRMLGTVDRGRIKGVGHRVVHGGTRFQRSVRIDAAVLAAIHDLTPLAPLHNPVALAVIAAISTRWPDMPQVAAFDTAFHSTLAPAAFLYAVPYAWYTDWGVRRFGFHGLSHAYCAGRAAELLARPAADLRLVTAHLGSGCSLAAIAGGRSVATTMGFTPLEGLMMGTRSGSLDPGLLLYLLGQGRLDVAALDHALNHEAGLQGVSALSSDMRVLLKAQAAGHVQAGLALDLYTARIREGIAAMTAALGGLDALVFTAGVGEHAAAIRTAVVESLGWMGLRLDGTANQAATPDMDIATPDSPVRILVIQTHEEAVVAADTARLLAHAPAGE